MLFEVHTPFDIEIRLQCLSVLNTIDFYDQTCAWAIKINSLVDEAIVAIFNDVGYQRFGKNVVHKVLQPRWKGIREKLLVEE